MDSSERLKETQLPPKEAFYARLHDEHISDEDYALAQNVWKEFNMETLEEIHNLLYTSDFSGSNTSVSRE